MVGTAQSFGGPAYSALVPSLVEKEDLPNAIALNSIQFNLARVIGPVLGGLALKYAGAAWCFGLNALSFVAVIISLLRLHINFNPPRTGESILTGMKQGIRIHPQTGRHGDADRDRVLHDGAGYSDDHFSAGLRQERVSSERNDVHAVPGRLGRSVRSPAR